MRSQEPVFPSWSWAGLEGEIEYERKINACESIVSKSQMADEPREVREASTRIGGPSATSLNRKF